MITKMLISIEEKCNHHSSKISAPNELIENENPVSFFECMPEEIILHILSFLTLKDLLSVLQVNWLFYTVGNNPSNWKCQISENLLPKVSQVIHQQNISLILGVYNFPKKLKFILEELIIINGKVLLFLNVIKDCCVISESEKEVNNEMQGMGRAVLSSSAFFKIRKGWSYSQGNEINNDSDSNFEKKGRYGLVCEFLYFKEFANVHKGKQSLEKFKSCCIG